MSLTETLETGSHDTAASQDVVRLVVLVAVGLAFVVALWALMKGGDRDLASRPAMVLAPFVQSWIGPL